MRFEATGATEEAARGGKPRDLEVNLWRTAFFSAPPANRAQDRETVMVAEPRGEKANEGEGFA